MTCFVLAEDPLLVRRAKVPIRQRSKRTKHEPDASARDIHLRDSRGGHHDEEINSGRREAWLVMFTSGNSSDLDQSREPGKRHSFLERRLKPVASVNARTRKCRSIIEYFLEKSEKSDWKIAESGQESSGII